MLGVLEHNAFDHIRDVFTAIEGFFQEFIDLFPFDDISRLQKVLSYI
jgi:hypothetical protein